MANLQQKMKQIEAERQDIRSGIKKLNERLEALTTTTPTFGELLKANHLPIEVPKSNTVTKKTGSGDFTEYPLSQLPGFMRPTASSTRKFGVDKQTSKNKDSVPTIKRRSSRRAESVSFPLNNTSEYNSDCSISRTSCLVDLNMKDSADNETEYSQDTSEYDIKMVVPSEQEKPLKSSVRQKLHPSHGEGNENRKTYKVSSADFFKVDNWLHLHKNDPKPTSYAPKSKRVPAIPNPKKNIRSNDQNITEKLPDEKVHDHEFSLRLINHDKFEKLDNVGVAGRSFDNTPTLLKDFLNKNSSSNSVSPPSHTIDAEIMIKRLGSEDGLSIEDNTCGTFTLADLLCGRYNQDNDNKGVNGMSDMQVVTSEAQISDEFTLNKNSCCNYFPSDIDNGIIDLKEDSDVSVSTSELELHHQQVPTDMGMNDHKKEDLHVSSQQTEKGTRPCIYKLRSRTAPFMENVDQKDHSLPLVESQGNTQNKGIFNIIKQKIQTLYASALLGLGFQNLGYEHDFFYGLML